MLRKPTPDMEAVRAMREALSNDPKAEFVLQLYNRAGTLLGDTDLAGAAIVFEMMQSASSAFEGGLTHEDIADGYPDIEWREDTVEIPRAWMRVLAEGWANYKSASTGSTLGEALGVEGGGQGKQPAREQLRRLNSGIRLSNRALVEYLNDRSEGGRGSWARAFVAVAEAEGTSEDTVERACKKYLKSKLSSVEYYQLLETKGAKLREALPLKKTDSP